MSLQEEETRHRGRQPCDNRGRVWSYAVTSQGTPKIVGIKKNETMPFAATWMDLEIIIPSEVSQTEEDKYHMILLICGI